MKKVLFLMAIFATMIFASCDKNNEITPKVLSEFIIGEWMAEDVPDFGDDVYMTTEFKTDGKYVLAISNGMETITLDPANYSVNNKTDVLTVDEPEWPETMKSLVLADQTSFIILWNEALNGNMAWTEEGEEFSLVWTRQ